MKTYSPDSSQDRRDLAASMKAMLVKAGFKLENPTSVMEERYSFQTPNAQIRVVVYSTIVNGVCRENGKDAIRVVAVYTARDGSERGIAKETRINRTGTIEGITERTLERMRSIYKTSFKPVLCHCGAPKFTSKAKNLVCAELCWVKK